MYRFAHIKSFGDLRKKFPAAAPAASAAAAADDDDDVDLFGSDDEVNMCFKKKMSDWDELRTNKKTKLKIDVIMVKTFNPVKKLDFYYSLF